MPVENDPNRSQHEQSAENQDAKAVKNEKPNKSKLGLILGCAVGIPCGLALILFAIIQCRKSG